MCKACVVPRTSHFIAVLVLSLPLITILQAQDPTPSTHDISAIYRLAGQPTGTYRESASRDSTGSATSIESDLIFNRLGTKLEMKSSSQYREDSAGHLKSAASDQSSFNRQRILRLRSATKR
ncbi:MAG TPA: hypothetical protein VMX38_19095 [Verrucomicrobiae bacterium]|nr:hypothetical protein [Verrucomicrobiae bacterium]